MNTHQSSHHAGVNTVAKPGGARGEYKKLFKAYFETFIEGGRGQICQK